MSPDKNFRLNKTAKRMIALMGGSAESRNQYKRMCIEAQVTLEAAHRQSLKSKTKDKSQVTE
jgi:hypothetical protein